MGVSSGTKYHAQEPDAFQTGDEKQVLAAAHSHQYLCLALYRTLCAARLCRRRDFPLADFVASCRVTEALQGAVLELSLVRSENVHVMMRKLPPSGLFFLFLA